MKKKEVYNFFCIVKNCGKIKNGRGQYCFYHQTKSKYIKSDPILTEEWKNLWNPIKHRKKLDKINLKLKEKRDAKSQENKEM